MVKVIRFDTVSDQYVIFANNDESHERVISREQMDEMHLHAQNVEYRM